MEYNVTTALQHRSTLGEGPVWDIKTGTICWVDILKGEIHEFNPVSGFFHTIKVHQYVGAVALCNDGNFLAALKNGLAIINRGTGKLNWLAHPEPHLPNNRLNDGKADPLGRFWVGTMSVDELPGAGGLYMLGRKQDISKKISNTTISNGMAWSSDHQIFYYIDTPTLAIVAYDHNKNDGEIANPRTVITFAEEDGYPDGMTIDSEGMLWIAHWNGWQVTRWDPATGEKLFSLPLPVANVTSCTFGGNELTDLYITTAKKGLNVAALEKQPLAGSLFVWKNTGYSGMPAFEFKNLHTV
jgi:sugar lactone lactonase YvrE